MVQRKRRLNGQRAAQLRWNTERAKKQLSDEVGSELQELTNDEVIETIEAPVEEDEEDDPTVPPTICIICCCPAHKKKYPTKVKFLLGQVVPYSLLCDSHFRQEEIEQHIDLCVSCVRLLGKGERLHERIVTLEKELDKVKNNVKKLVQSSALVKQEEDEDGGNLVVGRIYGNIREQLLSDFVRKEDEESFFVADWSGVNFYENEEQQTENIFRPEIGNDSLEFAEDSVVEEVVENNSLGEDSSIANRTGTDIANSTGEDSSIANLTGAALSTNIVNSVGADSSIANSIGAIANSVVSGIKQDYRNFPEFQKLHKGKVVATYSKTTPKRSIAPIKISKLLKVQHKDKKKYIPKPSFEKSKIPTVKKPSVLIHQTGIFGHLVTPSKTGGNFSLPLVIDEPISVPEVRKLPELTTPTKSGNYPCAICPDRFDTPVEATLHRKFIHPGLTLCASPVLSLQYGKIFRSCDVKRHRIESHPLLRCPECRESFTSTDRLASHVETVHHPDGSALPPLPEFGYDVKLIPWVIPMTKDEIREATRDQGFFRVNLTRVEIKDTSPQHVVVEQAIGENVDEAVPSGLVSQMTNESNNEQEILKNGTDSVAKNISTTPNANVFSTELTQPVPLKLKKKKIIYNCGVCNTKFPVQSDLLQHLADAHNQAPKFGCFVCLKEFTSLSECEAHVLSDHPDTKVHKQKVKMNTRNIDKIPQNKYRMWPFMCKLCRLRFISLPVLQEHIKSEDHVKTVELGRLETCPRHGCEDKYRGQAELDSHLAEHRKIKCPQCHFKFADSNLLLHHRVRCHKYVLTEAESLQPVVHPCRVENCGKLFSSFNHKARLAKHMASTHGIGEHTCHQCGKVFSELRLLNHHVKHVHDKVPGKHMCDICGKRFTKRRYLNSHRPIHGEERRFLCSECGKSFKTSTSLTIHKYSHDPERWTKHYPYRILVEKRLQTQRKREAAAASISGGPTTVTKRRTRKSNISGAEIVDQFVSTEEEEVQM